VLHVLRCCAGQEGALKTLCSERCEVSTPRLRSVPPPGIFPKVFNSETTPMGALAESTTGSTRYGVTVKQFQDLFERHGRGRRDRLTLEHIAYPGMDVRQKERRFQAKPLKNIAGLGLGSPAMAARTFA